MSNFKKNCSVVSSLNGQLTQALEQVLYTP